MQLEVTEQEAHAIRYALGELANKRQEQAVDYWYNPESAKACQAEAHSLRTLQQHVADQIGTQL